MCVSMPFASAMYRVKLTLSTAAVAEYVQVWLWKGTQVGHVYDVEVVKSQTPGRKQKCDFVVIGMNRVRYGEQDDE